MVSETEHGELRNALPVSVWICQWLEFTAPPSNHAITCWYILAPGDTCRNVTLDWS